MLEGDQGHQLWALKDQGPGTVMLGCSTCVDRNVCGGLSIANGGLNALDCMSMCQCTEPEKCAVVCPTVPIRYVRRMTEVSGFDFSQIPVAKARSLPALPDLALLVEGSIGGPTATKALTYAAVPLSMTVAQAGQFTRAKTRQELQRTFGVAPRLGWIATGVEKDRCVERMWRVPSPVHTYKGLQRAGVIFATTPNFSTPANVPRQDNLHAMMRIAWTWYEMVDAGLPTALHLNGRTDHDFRRWAEFAAAQPSLKAVAFEFLTGAEPKEDGRRYVARLKRFVQDSGRTDLLLVLRGGRVWLDELKEVFPKTLTIDSGAYIKTIKRQRIIIGANGRPRYGSHRTNGSAEVRALFLHNAQARLSLHAHRFGAGRPVQAELGFDTKEDLVSVATAPAETDHRQMDLFGALAPGQVQADDKAA